MRGALWLFVLLLVSPALAEVRVVQDVDGPNLIIRPSARGVWAPTPSGVNRDLLNPSGDVRGDGFPAFARQSGRLLVAWTRPASQSVVAVEVTGGHSSTFEIAAPHAAGIPVPLATPDGWMLFWQVEGADRHVESVSIDGSVLALPSRIADGEFLSAIPLEDGFAVVSVDPDVGYVIVTRQQILPIPVPISRVFVSYQMSALAGADAGAFPQVCLSTAEGEAAVVVKTDHSRAALVELEPELATPVTIRAPNGSCAGLLRAAQR